MEEIFKENEVVINEIKNNYNIDEINIICKGPTAKYIEKSIGINQAIIFTDCDFLFLNDFESLFGIEHLLYKVKYVFCPDFPHVKCHPDINFSYLNLIDYLNNFNFNGKIFIYQIQKTLSKNINTKYKFESHTTTDIPIQFFKRFFYTNKFNLYGFKNGSGYHDSFNPNNMNYDTVLKFNEKYKNYYNFYLKNISNKNFIIKEPNNIGIKDKIFYKDKNDTILVDIHIIKF